MREIESDKKVTANLAELRPENLAFILIGKSFSDLAQLGWVRPIRNKQQRQERCTGVRRVIALAYYQSIYKDTKGVGKAHDTGGTIRRVACEGKAVHRKPAPPSPDGPKYPRQTRRLTGVVVGEKKGAATAEGGGSSR